MISYFNIHQIDYGKLNREQLNIVNKNRALIRMLGDYTYNLRYKISVLDRECFIKGDKLLKNTYFSVNLEPSISIDFIDNLNYLHSLCPTMYYDYETGRSQIAEESYEIRKLLNFRN